MPIIPHIVFVSALGKGISENNAQAMPAPIVRFIDPQELDE
jgi:hypothetical protein